MEPQILLDHIIDDQETKRKSTIGFASSSSNSSSTSPEEEEDGNSNSIINTSSNSNGIESGTSCEVVVNDHDHDHEQQKPRRTDNSHDHAIIHVYDDDDNGEDKICRICHLSAEPEPSSGCLTAGLMELGCSCKGELSISHQRCAETWFKHKGNSVCEVCGARAKNVKLVKSCDSRMFIGDYEDVIIRPVSSGVAGEEEGSGRWCKQSCCNILLACLVLGLVLPWFLKTDLL